MNPWIIVGIVAFATLLVIAFAFMFANHLIASMVGEANRGQIVAILAVCLVGALLVGGLIWENVLK